MANKSRNQMVVVGTIIETNIKYDKETKSMFDDRIVGGFATDDFKNPMFRIEVEANEEKMISHAIVDVNMYDIYEKRTKSKDDDSLIDNETFKALASLFEYNPSTKEWNFDTAIGKRVKITGTLEESMYAKDGEMKRFNQIRGQYVETNPSKLPDYDFAEVKLTGFINKISDETKGEDEIATGRKKIQFMYVTTKGGELTGNMLDLIVPADIVDGFDETFDEKMNASLDVEIVTATYGGQTKKSGGFGKKSSHVVGGYTTTEYRIFNGSEIEEDEDDKNSKFLTDKDVKKAKEMRKTTAEAKLKKAEEKKAEAEANKGGSGLGKYKKTANVTEEPAEDDDDPFFD